MRLSELQKEIQKLIDRNGDTDVKVYSSFYQDFVEPKPFVILADGYGRMDIHILTL